MSIERLFCTVYEYEETERGLFLTINYNHPILTVSIEEDIYLHDFPYVYEGSIEDILKANNIYTQVIAEYFIDDGIKNINYINIEENIIIIGFPLDINGYKKTVNISCLIEKQEMFDLEITDESK
jgi:hypothetical protein